MRHKETKKPPVKRVANELPIIEVVREAVKRTSKMIEPGGAERTERAILQEIQEGGSPISRSAVFQRRRKWKS